MLFIGPVGPTRWLESIGKLFIGIPATLYLMLYQNALPH